MSGVESDSILTEVIVSIAVSVGGGTLLGYWLSESSRKKQEKKDIKKIKDLLKNDYERINKNNNNNIKKILQTIDSLEKKTQLGDEFLDPLHGGRILNAHRGSFVFNYWNVAAKSNLLIRLSAHEIRELEIIHDVLIKYDKLSMQANYKRREFLIKFAHEKISIAEKKELVKEQILGALYTFLLYAKGVYESFEEVQIDWFNKESLPEVLLNQVNSKVEEQSQKLSTESVSIQKTLDKNSLEKK